MPDSQPSRIERLRPWIGFALLGYWLSLLIATHVPLPEGTMPGQSDKLAHFAAYGGLGLLLAGWLATRAARFSLRPYVLAFVIAALYGIADELLQIPVGREGDLIDWLADGAGALIGVAAAAVLVRVLGERRA